MTAPQGLNTGSPAAGLRETLEKFQAYINKAYTPDGELQGIYNAFSELAESSPAPAEDAAEAYCSLNCPSVKKAGGEWTHTKRCREIRAALSTPAQAPAAGLEPSPTGSARWRYNQDQLFCGTMRIMRGDWDTNPAPERKEAIMQWACRVLNAAAEANPGPQSIAEAMALEKRAALSTPVVKESLTAAAMPIPTIYDPAHDCEDHCAMCIGLRMRRGEKLFDAPVPSVPASTDATVEPDAKRGLYGKFRVRRNDGSSGPGGKHEHCDYYVLDLIHDKHAFRALLAYAESCLKEFPALAVDLRARAFAMSQQIEGLEWASQPGPASTGAARECWACFYLGEEAGPLPMYWSSSKPKESDVDRKWVRMVEAVDPRSPEIPDNCPGEEDLCPICKKPGPCLTDDQQASLERGIEQAKRGEIYDLGSFAKYAEEGTASAPLQRAFGREEREKVARECCAIYSESRHWKLTWDEIDEDERQPYYRDADRILALLGEQREPAEASDAEQSSPVTPVLPVSQAPEGGK